MLFFLIKFLIMTILVCSGTITENIVGYRSLLKAPLSRWLDETKVLKHDPLPSKDSCLKSFGPKYPIIQGFWAILMLRVWVHVPT